jgi:D-alanyl-D-alanine carboxypeptidase/D-alanyl-D-alanine-endopeptidase (penicillin-binding protein 4)
MVEGAGERLKNQKSKLKPLKMQFKFSKKISILYFIFFNFYFLFFLISCSVSKQISKQTTNILLKDTAISTGHIGISIYEPASNKYWYNYNSNNYFIPGSNTKLFTLYAGIKYLGDSLTALAYQNFSDTAINIVGTGDPTFMHSNFENQPALDFLKAQHKTIYLSANYTDSALGYGWAWDDYNDDYMVERNGFPIYGNTIKIGLKGYNYVGQKISKPIWNIIPKYFTNYIDSEFILNYKTLATLPNDSNFYKQKTQSFIIQRERTSNKLNLQQGNSVFRKSEIPFVTNAVETTAKILKTDFQLNITDGSITNKNVQPGTPANLRWHKIKSQPTDSLFKPMMHRSDNFFAEQTLLMVSNEYLGYMSTEKIIETLLTSDLKDVPQMPKWVDGCGLSRYNLFTPQSFIYILNKMKNEFGMDRLKNILATGGTGTLTSYYKKDSGYIFAKTGTLSNNCALSGYLITRKGKIIIFSILANNYITNAVPVRKAVEKYLLAIREKY